jgi:hypothetical protein
MMAADPQIRRAAAKRQADTAPVTPPGPGSAQ